MNQSRRKFIKISGAAAGMLFLPSLGGADGLAGFSPASLPRSIPEKQGISSKAIRDFIKAIHASGIQWHSFMLLRHGSVVAEGWWKPFDPSYKHTLYSLSKSFTSTAIGLLVKEGKIKVTDSLISFFPEDLPAELSDNLKKVAVKHVLTMNSGHSEDTISKMREAAGKSWTKAYLELPVPFEPGSHFLYNTGNTYMLGAIVHKITGETLEQYLAPRLFEPLGIEGYDWEKSPQGLNTAGYGLRIKTEDIARFGQLYLQKGKWEGREILPEAWVDEATSSQTSSQAGNGDWSQGYGYQFWRCKPGFYRGDGAFGQYCIVMPVQDAVLAITSESWDMQKSMTTAWEQLLPAMQKGELPIEAVESAALKQELKDLILPVYRGSVTSPTIAGIDGKSFAMDTNAYGMKSILFNFSKSGGELKLSTVKGEVFIPFGWESWVTNKQTINYPFEVAGRIHVPSKIAGTATWTDDATLQLNLRFVEAIHGDKITCRFEKDRVNMAFLNSVAENTKNNPEKRAELSGRRGA